MSKGPKPIVDYTPSTSGHSSPLTPEPLILETVGGTSPSSVHNYTDYSETREAPSPSHPPFEEGPLGDIHCYGPWHIASTSNSVESVEPPMKRSRRSCGPTPLPSNLSDLGYSIESPIDLDQCAKLEPKDGFPPQSESDIDSVIICIKR